MREPIKVYCEDAAFRPYLKALEDAGRITLVRFPYENKNRRTKRARPSRITCDAKLIFCDDTEITCADSESEMWERIQAIVRREGRPNDYDVRHIDSAYKTGCGSFFTCDKRDILNRRAELEALLPMRFFHP